MKPSKSTAGGTEARGPEGEPVLHVYDGIEELDNQLPLWWVYTFVGSVIFAAAYWVYYHNVGKGVLPSEQYANAKLDQAAAEAQFLLDAGEVTPELLTALAANPGTVDQGKTTYAQICVTCHADGGKGSIGPNLTDEFWIHGADEISIYKMVRDGFLPKQMPAWGKQLGEARTRAVAAYVLTLRNTNAPGGKAPQGEKGP